MEPAAPPKIHRVEVEWHAVTYKTVIVYGILVAVIVLAGMFIVFPSTYSAVTSKISSAMTNTDGEGGPASQTQAKFVNLDGRVQVKKVNSVQWVEADYRTTLDKGDLIQTAADGAARIAFADSTSYTIKADTLVTVEENNVTHDQANTAVRVNVGAVDLSTPNWSSPNSHAAVSMEDTVAEIRPNSRASVKSDPKNKQSEIQVGNGSAEVKRGNERVELGPFQRATIPSTGPITKADVLAPPELSQPLNLAPITVETPRAATIRFEWKPVKDAVSYTVRISTTAMFTKMVKQVKVSSTSAEVSGLDGGDYFWNVFATDANKQNSEVSETFKFAIFAQGRTQEMMLEIGGTRMNGRSVEIYGKTEPGAALIINGQSVPPIGSDGTFRFFTEPIGGTD